ncbi:hypothetical protein [Nonomuraea soli]|uniref:S8 family serine peptidase n=1 Tax=Nonomuraea soli TaxID=1032476 RepID=A0A7W0HP61_9ACTN|nr:hypothetical protein [Nonomuraea soli]MBA2890543.1 hypothetical protein [Nonomuraea soli]
MLTKSVACVTAALALAWAPSAQATRDFAAAQRVTKGAGVTVALLSSGVGWVDGIGDSFKGEHDLLRRTKDPLRRTKQEDGDPAPAASEGTAAPGGPFAGRDPAKVTGTRLAALLTAPTGLVPDANVLSVRVEPDPQDFADPEAMAAWRAADLPGERYLEAIRWAVDHGAGVIVLDSVFPAPDERLREAVGYALDANAVLVTPVRPGQDPRYPAGLPGVLGVAPLGDDGRPVYEARNHAVVLSAPGHPRDLPAPDGSTGAADPGLAAAAQVGAAAAMLQSRFPGITSAQAGQALTATARRPHGAAWKDSADFAYDTAIGFGQVNPAGALIEAERIMSAPAGQAGVPEETVFGGGPPPAPVAAGHDGPLLYGSAALLGAGALLLAGVVLLLRRHSRAGGQGAEVQK